jgi:GrpB-like predicted nucleotidyltransferase (UPF0157 family)
VDPDLEARLTAAGIDPSAPGDPAAAWRRLFAAVGLRATLVDRYALEAEARGLGVADLPCHDREEMWREVMALRYPGMELHGDHGGDPVEVVPYDPAWPDAFAAWRDRLAAALGPAARRIEHIGSTAVPGLAAKPVIDVQVAVPDVTDEKGFAPALEGLGLPLRTREPGHRYFRPPRGRPREVQVHVCDAGGRWERTHLLFRDYLRAHRGAREAYSALKRTLAAEFRHDRWAYNEAKTGFILDSLEAAERWAAAIGWSPGGPA